ncbi:MAG: M28 family peptidase [Chryseolinea sp.]
MRLQSTDTLMQHYANEVSEAGLKENVTILASDFMEGRETGKRGQRMAASFIRAHFNDNKLLPPVAGDYLQPLELYRVGAGETYVQAGKSRFENYQNIAYFGMEDSGGEVTTSIVFVGYGEDGVYQQVDVRDKAVLLLSRSSWVAGSKEVTLARERGAKAVFVCNTQTEQEFARVLAQGKRFVERGRLTLEKPNASEHVRPGVFVVSPHAAGEFMGSSLNSLKNAAEKKLLRKIKPATITYKTSIEISPVPTENVLGLVEGSDKKNEILLVTAHYDHVGIKQDGTGDVIHNGADDDGSGTVAVMELARVFCKGAS